VRTHAEVQTIRRDNGCYVVQSAAGEFRSTQLVLAVPPTDAGRLLDPLDAELGGTLTSIPMSPVAVVHLGYPRGAAAVPDGFGFLAPRGGGVRSLGVLFPSRLFEGRAPAGGDLLSAFVGGMLDPGALALTDDELIAIVCADLRKLTGLEEEPGFTKVLRFPAAIPQLTLGHLERMARIQSRLGGLPGLALAGNYLRGVGLKDAVISGFEAAACIAPGAGGSGASVSGAVT
jgi:oxygen-dependent protoporphyrinogen oxidase